MEITQNFKLSDKEYQLFADFIYQQSGIDLGSNKQELVKTRFGKRIRKLGLSSFKEYYNFVVKEGNKTELVNMIDAISTNYTFFYREKDHFDFLLKTAIPQILSKKQASGNRRIRAWCAAASTGEEPYTIMLCLLEGIKNLTGWDLKMLATDISTKVLAKAQAGVYEKKQVEAIPKFSLDKYFENSLIDGEKQYKVNTMLKNFISFRHFNLMTPRFPFKGKFDFIFCRNVMIYFDRATQETLIQKMVQTLEVGGYLFIGHSENLSGPAKKNLRNLGPALFQKTG